MNCKALSNLHIVAKLLHPVAKSLEAEEPWMLHLLRAFNTGDINKFDELVHTYSKELQNQVCVAPFVFYVRM